MVKHIVLWKMKETPGVDKQTNMQALKQKIEGLLAIIPQARKLEVGFNGKSFDGAFDVALYSEFDDWEGLETYYHHPEHLKVVEFVRSVVSERRAVDYEV